MTALGSVKMLSDNPEYMETLKSLGGDLEYLAEIVVDTPQTQCVLSVCNNTISKERKGNWSFDNERSTKHGTVLKAARIYANGYFEDIIGGDDAGCMKPSACPLDRVIRGFDIRDKEKVMMVGDMDIDVLAGKNAGVKTCAVTYGIGKREDIVKAAPDYIIDDFIELKRIIG